MKFVMASLDDAGKTTNLYRMTLDTATTVTPVPTSRVWNTEAWSSLSGTLEDKKADDEIAYSEPDDKLGKSPFPKASRKSQAFESCGVPIGILGRESRDPKGQRGME